jgi:hypothetical protein
LIHPNISPIPSPGAALTTHFSIIQELNFQYLLNCLTYRLISGNDWNCCPVTATTWQTKMWWTATCALEQKSPILKQIESHSMKICIIRSHLMYNHQDPMVDHIW